RSSQQPHQMHSGRHHSHSVSSIHNQHQVQAQAQVPPPPPQQQQQQPHIPPYHGQHQRTGSGLSAHVAYAALPQQPQPAV
ncbi:hypothetical protein CPC16_010594, partial [Podila verticillata]